MEIFKGATSDPSSPIPGPAPRFPEEIRVGDSIQIWSGLRGASKKIGAQHTIFCKFVQFEKQTLEWVPFQQHNIKQLELNKQTLELEQLFELQKSKSEIG